MSGQVNILTPAKVYITDRHRPRIHPLPPPIIGHLTALTCPECPLGSTSQLRYHPPSFRNAANINWQCHEPTSNHGNGKSYIRTLNLEHLINNIRAVNAGARPLPTPGSLSGLLNMSNEVPDHMKIKSTGKLCTGYLGKTGATHHSSTKSNMKCSHTLCLSCCQMSQQVHHLTCKYKGHLSTPSSGDFSMTTPQIRSTLPFPPPKDLISGSSEQLHSSNQSSHKQIQSAQANRTVTSTLTPSQLLEYHQNIQAVALLANSREAAKRGAVCTIWIELWTKPGSSTMINAEAPHWPLFSLQESQIVLDRCRKALSGTDSWESEIQVWNTEQARWISLAPTCTSTYPLIPRKLLVRLEKVSAYDCTGLQDAILKMTTEGPYELLTTPARCILASSNFIDTSNSNSIDKLNTNLMPSANSHVLTNLHNSGIANPNTYQGNSKSSASKTDSTHSDIEWIGSSLAPKGSPEVPTQMEKSHPKWPDSRVLLCQTIRWHASSEHQGHHRDAWDQFFGEGYDYGHTTVYRVRKWISRVGKEPLERHVQDNPSLTLIAARQMYFQEWLDTKKARGKDKNQLKPKREGQVAEVENAKRRKVDHGQGLLDANFTEDSDVEILGN
ncbi:hypothetical protein H4Q26_013663 [Puccinia striiformis f. sp. tritici PST-130]|nr:hypothetical protein H4Q26_013663 [Puccinia striiformis f. sp. tritici PST-130]